MEENLLLVQTTAELEYPSIRSLVTAIDIMGGDWEILDGNHVIGCLDEGDDEKLLCVDGWFNEPHGFLRIFCGIPGPDVLNGVQKFLLGRLFLELSPKLPVGYLGADRPGIGFFHQLQATELSESFAFEEQVGIALSMGAAIAANHLVLFRYILEHNRYPSSHLITLATAQPFYAG